MKSEEIFHKLALAGEDWADKEAAAQLLEETKHTVLAECMAKWPDESNVGAETKARRDQIYKDHLAKMVAARREANKAKVRYYSIQTWIDLRRTQEATERAKIAKGL